MSANNDLPDWFLLGAYFSETCATEEQAAIEAWAAAAPEHRTLLEQLREAWKARQARAPRDWGHQDAIATVRAQIRSAPKTSNRPKGRALYWGIGIGLTVALAIIGTRASVHSAPAPRRYTTDVGQTASLLLSDHSRVTLAPQSRLVVSAAFGHGNRTVTLEGEAYFDVTASAGTPFVVQTARIETRVLGTAFDVRRYADERVTRVAVLHGKVMSGTARSRTTLVAGNVGLVTDSVPTTVLVNGADTYTAWTQNRLIFDGTPVPVMLATLGRWYGYQFRLADSTLMHERVKAEFRIGVREETMQLLKRVLDVTLTFDGSVVTLSPRSSPQPAHRMDRALFSHPLEAGR